MNEQVQRPGKVKRFIKETMRVLRVTKKPNNQEFKSIVKVSGMGIAVIGAIGFVIFMLSRLI